MLKSATLLIPDSMIFNDEV